MNCLHLNCALAASNAAAPLTAGKGAKGLAGSGKGAKVKGSGDKKKPISRSVKAGLQFPVGRIHRFLKARGPRIAPLLPSAPRRARAAQAARPWTPRAAPRIQLRAPARVAGALHGQRPCRCHRRRVQRCHSRCEAAQQPRCGVFSNS